MPRARTRILRQLERRPKQTIAQLLDDPRREEIADEFMEHASSVLDGDPAAGVRLAAVAIRFSRHLGELHLARALGILAMAHRARGHYSKARQTLELAFEHAGDDRRVRALLERRRAHLLGSEGDLETALQQIASSIELARSIGDVDSEGRSFVVRGILQGLRGEHREATRSAQTALSKLCPKASASFRRSALYVTSISVAKSGSLADVRSALGQFSAINANFKGKYSRAVTVERAYVKWVEGLLHQRLGANNRARQLLEQARRHFIKVQMPQEIAAITADLALIVHDSRDEVREVVRPVQQLSRAKSALFSPGVVHGLQKIWDSTRAKSPWEDQSASLHSRRSLKILEAVRELRELFEDNKAIPALLLPLPPTEELADASPIGF